MNRARDTSWGSTPPEATRACPVCGKSMPWYRRECSPACLVAKVRERGFTPETPGPRSAPAVARELLARPVRAPGAPVPTSAPCLCCGVGIDITPPHQSRRYCELCRVEQGRAAVARARARAQDAERPPRTCVVCETPLPVMAPLQTRFCAECRVQRERARWRADYHDRAARRRAGGEG